MKLRILTANIAMGNPNADKLLPAIKSLLWFHNWRVIPFLVSRGRFDWVFDYSSHSRRGRIEWFKAHSSLKNVIALVAQEMPDVFVLNELLYQIHYEPLNAALKEFGEGEQRKGRHIIIAGDFNATNMQIQNVANFSSLGLKTVTTQTTNPTCLPKFFRTACDHIFLPSSWRIEETRFPSFGSDHLSVVTQSDY